MGRIDQLLAAAPAGAPDADDDVQAEQALREPGTLEQADPRDGDETLQVR